MPEWTPQALSDRALAFKIKSINCNYCIFLVILQVVHKLIHCFCSPASLLIKVLDLFSSSGDALGVPKSRPIKGH